VSGGAAVTGRRKDRPLEWFLAGYSILWGGAAYLANGDPNVRVDAPMLFDDAAWGGVSAALGVAHMVCLLINGTMGWTPAARLFVTAVNAGFFAKVAAMLWFAEGVASSVSATYVAVGFIWCAYVAGQDAARMRLGSYGL